MSISPKRQDILSYLGTFFLPAGSLTTPEKLSAPQRTISRVTVVTTINSYVRAALKHTTHFYSSAFNRKNFAPNVNFPVTVRNTNEYDETYS